MSWAGEGFAAWVTTDDETINHDYKSNKEVGLNVFPAPPGKSIFEMITHQFKDRMVQVLLFAVVMGFVFAFFEEDPEERTSALNPL
jgi:Na+/H+-dicarboxylate symporter